MSYTPDKWVVLKIDNPKEDKPWYRLFTGWYGGYAAGDSWRANSGITKIEYDKDNKVYLIHGNSGSVYKCKKELEGLSAYMDSVLYGMLMTAAEKCVSVTVIPIKQAVEELNNDTYSS